ncbi:hypothetical protein Tco_1383769 [Tanacetum coccineum]
MPSRFAAELFGFDMVKAGKEVDIVLDGGHDKPLRPADMLLYSWDGGLDVCVDLTGSSPLTQTGMADFVPGRAVIDAAQRKRSKYMAKCAAIGYGFLPFSFSSLGELEADAVTLLKRIRKFSMTQDIRARDAVHIFNRISFAIAKGIVTASGPGFGDWQLRLATLPIKLGGLGILLAGDISKRFLLLSMLSEAFQHNRNKTATLCHHLYFCPKMMKSLAKCYFGVIEKDLVSMLSVPMFSEGSLCPSCIAHRMDQWGDHAVYCSSEVGVKFRHNLVRDILVDICSKVGIMVRKEAPMGFLSEDGNDLRPADLLLFNWLQGKDACLDVTCISPFAGMGGLCLWLLGIAMHNAGGEEKEEVCVNMRGKRIQVHTICFLYVRGIRHGGFGHTFPY